MFNKLKKIEKRGKEVYFLNQQGYVVSIPSSDYDIVMKYGNRKKMRNYMPKIIKELADAQILIFDNYIPNEDNLNFDDALIKSNNDKPIYKAPIISHFSVTHACNMNCAYCSVRNIHKGKKELSTDECKKIIDKLVNWGVFQIGLTGGEPTVRKDIVELVRYTSAQNVACNLTTNGWNVSKELVDQLVEAGLTQVQLSLDSHIEEVHEKYRKKGSFKRVMNTAKMFKDKGLIVGFDTVVTNDNLDQIEPMILFLEKEGYDGLTLLKLKQGDLNLEIFKKLVPDYESYGKVVDKICKYKGELDVTLDCGSVCNLCMTLTDKEIKKLHSAGCPAGHTLIHIDNDGNMYPCAGLSQKEFSFGNILNEDPYVCWNNNEMLKKMRNIKNVITGKCKTCPKLDNCRGGCRSISYSFGDLFSSDQTCEMKL
ncbi:MAG: radical SAM protein [Bacilli bacterium]|nr:radical SAM protein [Bacilli bacterium]MDD4298734.1 radical SAM protein [Bacilli bacterium]